MIGGVRDAAVSQASEVRGGGDGGEAFVRRDAPLCSGGTRGPPTGSSMPELAVVNASKPAPKGISYLGKRVPGGTGQ